MFRNIVVLQINVHPAFTFGGERLTGIWGAKFEASMAEINNNTIAKTM